LQEKQLGAVKPLDLVPDHAGDRAAGRSVMLFGLDIKARRTRARLIVFGPFAGIKAHCVKV